MVLTPRGLMQHGVRYPCSIGATGVVTHKAEGDRATPRGLHQVVGMLYRADRIAPPTPWAEPIGPNDLWSDDPQAAEYNHKVRRPYPHSHEALRRADPLYDLVILLDWNWPDAVPGKGSAIFVHQWRRPGYPTEGCIALSRGDLHRLARNVRPGARLLVR